MASTYFVPTFAMGLDFPEEKKDPLFKLLNASRPNKRHGINFISRETNIARCNCGHYHHFSNSNVSWDVNISM